MGLKLISGLALMMLVLSGQVNAVGKSHGFALNSELKYKKGFSHFDWANPNAPKRGTLKLGSRTTFDKLNPYTLKGTGPGILGDLVFETLVVSSLDEPFAQYGLIAEAMELAKDKLSVTFYLNKKAKFSDGKPVTAADVKFSLEALTSKDGHPFYKSYWSDVKSSKIHNKHTIQFFFKKVNPELHMVVGQLPVLPKHIYGKGNFASDYDKKAVGSGPYVLDVFEPGKRLKLKRNPKYWGANLNINKGKFNFDEIVLKVFRDQNIWLEGLKAGEFDFAAINSSKQWAVDVGGEKWDKNYLVKSLLKDSSTQGMQGFVFNTRKKIFQDRTLRKAIAIAFDFEWANKTLFYEQYTQLKSFWDNSELGAKGLPSKDELKLLNKWKGKIPDEVFTQAPTELGKGLNSRQRLREAKKLLTEAGWKLDKASRTLKKGNDLLKFEILISSAGWERIIEPYKNNLKKLGVDVTVKLVDFSQFQKKVKGHSHDMIIGSFGQSESPGNEQHNYWHSETVKEEGSRNYIGVNSPAIDALVNEIINAPSRKRLVTATNALDRVLWFSHYVVPHWYIASHRVTYWNKFGIPSNTPKYYAPSAYFMEYSWFDAAKAKKLEAAKKANSKLSM